MNVSLVSSASSIASQAEIQKRTPAPAPSQSSSLPSDTVTLSPAAQKVSGGGDVDHDGDSH